MAWWKRAQGEETPAQTMARLNRESAAKEQERRDTWLGGNAGNWETHTRPTHQAAEESVTHNTEKTDSTAADQQTTKQPWYAKLVPVYRPEQSVTVEVDHQLTIQDFPITKNPEKGMKGRYRVVPQEAAPNLAGKAKTGTHKGVPVFLVPEPPSEFRQILSYLGNAKVPKYRGNGKWV